MIDKLLHLRILVGYPGEKDQGNWWDTSFLNKTGQKFLEINFPRSAFAAAVHSVTEAAKQLHDRRIARGRVFHLFRLPATAEEKFHLQLLNTDFREELLRVATLPYQPTSTTACSSPQVPSISSSSCPIGERVFRNDRRSWSRLNTTGCTWPIACGPTA